MKINSISNYQRFNFLQNKNNLKNNTSNPIYNNLTPLKADTITFKGQDENKPVSPKTLKKMFTSKMKKIWADAVNIARLSGSSSIEDWHIYLASLYFIKKQLADIEQGITKYNDPNNANTLVILQNTIDRAKNEITNKDDRKKIAKVIDEHIEQVKKDFMPQGPKRNLKGTLVNPRPSKETMDNLIEAYQFYFSLGQIGKSINETFPLLAAGFSQDQKLVKNIVTLGNNLQKAVMIDNENHKKKKHMAFFDDKADILWKNISLGKDTVVLTDKNNSDSAKHLINSFVNLINKPNQHYKNVSKDDTDIVILNKNATFELLTTLANEAKEKPNKTTVIVADLNYLHAANGETISKQDIDTLINIPSEYDKSDVRFVFTIDKEAYYTITSKENTLGNVFETYSTQTLPTLNANDAIDYLTNENGVAFIEQETGKKFSPETIKKAIELTAQINGSYPDKAIDLLSTVSAYNPDIEDITPQIIVDYMKEAKILNNVQNDNDDGIIFDTGKTLDDIVGSPMTKAQAENVVRAIKNGTIGTRGYILSYYGNSDNGGGRFNTAQAIAGEAEVPMIVINAKDFALKDIDTLSENADFSEMKIKKIMSSAIAQAEVNPNKCAIVYIKNFDNFAANPLTGVSSIYEQKAFSQLLDEMDSIRRNKDVNIVVMGSMNIPKLIDPNIQKPYKFIDTIDIYPPQGTKETQDVLNYYIDKMGLTIAGNSERTRNKIIKNIAETISTQGYSVVDIMYLLETAKNASTEKNKETIDLNDLLEAFLRIEYGRTNTNFKNNLDKKITTTHEIGHAINRQVMYDLIKEQGSPWQVPNKLDFITLDPRSYFLGLVSSKESEETSSTGFENIMSDMICSYGGYSAEKKFFNINGSVGITQDMENINYFATKAVLDFGMGKSTGVGHIRRNPDGTLAVSEHKKELIEKDIDTMSKGAMLISDAIVETYKDFIENFSQKYCKKIGKGNCIIPAEKFQKELQAWKNSLSDEQKAKIKNMELYILNTLKSIQNGTFNGDAFTK